MRAPPQVAAVREGEPAETEAQRLARQAAENAGGGARRSSGAAVETMRREQPKVGRNEKCPCGSGKKFKHCHGR